MISEEGMMKQACMVMLALAVLALGACKTKSELKPSGQGEARAAAEATQSGLQMTLTTEPAQPQFDKDFVVRVHVVDQAGKAVPDATLRGSLNMKTMDMGKNEFEFTAKGDGNYETKVTPSMAGPWEIKVSAKRGGDVGEKSFELVVKE
jgi:nitrogen fixation protein FixH